MTEHLDIFEQLKERNRAAELGAGADKIAKRKEKGLMTARERLEFFCDEGTFQEIDKFVVHRCSDYDLDKTRIPGDAVVTGCGKVDGRPVYVFAQNFMVLGGSLSKVCSEKICKVMDMALAHGCPVIGLNDSGGARIQEGIDSLAGYGEIFWRNTKSSGVIPQISAILGPCAGGAVYSPAITDFIFMMKQNSYMFVTGPEVIKAVTMEEVTMDDLGGASAHTAKSGVVHFVADDEKQCLLMVRELLSFLPLNNRENPPMYKTGDPVDRKVPSLRELIPLNPKLPYDIKDVVTAVVDDGYFFEVQSNYAQNIVIGFARMNGRPIGVVANQPNYLAGCIDISASFKAARFVRFCDAFNVPLISVVDVPGFLPGTDQEYGGIIKHGAKLMYAFAEATVPKITIITRKAYGGAYIVMASKHLRSDFNFAYPNAEIAVMGSEGAVNILYRNDLKKAQNPEEARQQKLDEYNEKFANPYVAASRGYIDEVIFPEDTRAKIISALDHAVDKRETTPPRKHGNIPL
ncbi:MAG: acyl-CoA carboxylase subunit beta [Pseudomonadota bacterium]